MDRSTVVEEVRDYLESFSRLLASTTVQACRRRVKTEHSVAGRNLNTPEEVRPVTNPCSRKRAREEGVYQVHDWAKVRELDRQGVPKRRIAERLGCSRTTVYRLASLERPPRYERSPAGSLLDPVQGRRSRPCSSDDAQRCRRR